MAGEIATDTLVLPFDVRDDDAMLAATEKAIGWRDGVDIFVANAGVSQRSAAVDTDIAVYREIIDIDLTAQIAATQALLPHVTARGSGHLLFISSIAGKVGVPMRTAYCAAKFGLVGYADALRAELSQQGVSVHVVCPGSVATDVSRNALTADGSKRGRSDKMIDNGIAPNEAAKRIVDAVEANQREIIVARQGPPLLVGLGDDERFLASDPAALLAHTRDVIFLENGDLARLADDGLTIRLGPDGGDLVADRTLRRAPQSGAIIEIAQIKHIKVHCSQMAILLR